MLISRSSIIRNLSLGNIFYNILRKFGLFEEIISNLLEINYSNTKFYKLLILLSPIRYVFGISWIANVRRYYRFGAIGIGHVIIYPNKPSKHNLIFATLVYIYKHPQLRRNGDTQISFYYSLLLLFVMAH